MPLESPYESASAAQARVDGLFYRGGFTNIQDAILKCEASLNRQDGGAKFIVLLGDGEPNTCISASGCDPYHVGPKPGKGRETATGARIDAIDNSGIKIATVAIETTGDATEFIDSLASPSSLAFNINQYTALPTPDIANPIATAVADQICCRSCSDLVDCRDSEDCDIGSRRRKLRFGALEASGCCRAQ